MTIVGGTRKCKTCIHTHHTQSKNKGKYWSRISCTRNKQRSFTSVFFFLVLVCLVSSHGELSSKGRDAHILSLHGQQSSNFHSFTNCRLQFLQQKLARTHVSKHMLTGTSTLMMSVRFPGAKHQLQHTTSTSPAPNTQTGQHTLQSGNAIQCHVCGFI